MSLRLFVDHCVPQSILQPLHDAGHEVLSLKDHISPDSPDMLVISKAQQFGAVLVSLNGDFADIVTYPPEHYKGIIALQVRNRPEAIPQLISRLHDFLSAHPDMDYYVGKLFLIEVHRVRVRDMMRNASSLVTN